MTNSPPRRELVLCLACPAADLAVLPELLHRFGRALLPAGGVGDLPRAAGVHELHLLEVTADGPRSAVTWRARLASSTPLTDPDPSQLIPPTWHQRHPSAYLDARTARPVNPSDWDDEDEEVEATDSQIFVPITAIVAVPPTEWVFTNELVPKQQRMGRRFAPRAPTLVTLPE